MLVIIKFYKTVHFRGVEAALIFDAYMRPATCTRSKVS